MISATVKIVFAAILLACFFEIQTVEAFRIHRGAVLAQMASDANIAKMPGPGMELGDAAWVMDKYNGYAAFAFGVAAMSTNHLPEAQTVFSQSEDVMPHHTNLARALGIADFSLGKYPDALHYLERYLILVPMPTVTPGYIYRMTGISFYQLGQIGDALYYLTAAGKFADNVADVYRIRAFASLMINQNAVAEYCYRCYRHLAPDANLNPYDVVRNAMTEGKADNVTAFLEKVVATDSHDIPAVEALATLLAKNRQMDKALALVDKSIAANPKNATLYFLKGDLLYSVDRKSEAIKAYDKHLELEPTSQFKKDILAKKASLSQ